MDMLFITTNDRPTRVLGKLGEGLFSWKGIRVHGHIQFFLVNMDYILSCRCSPALPCYTVDLVPLTF